MLLDGFVGITDGPRLRCVSFADEKWQNAYFKGNNQHVEVKM